MRYDAFLSYSHRADDFRAVALQRALETLGKPFYRRRMLHVFRDKASLAANPMLWPAIERALAVSRFLVFLASPESAASGWCEKEIAWWLDRRSTDTLLLVLTGGELVYDERARDFDWTRTTALPPILKGKFAAEPHYCDLRWAERETPLAASHGRFRDDVLPIAAALHDKEPQELDGEDLHQFRRTRWFWRASVAALALLTATSIAAAWLASRKSDEAERERQIAVARQLAAEAEAARLEQAALLPRSALLAVEAVRRLEQHDVPSAELDRTLRQGLALLPRRPQALLHGLVIAMRVSSDGRQLATAGRDGWVALWNLTSGRELTRLDTRITASTANISPDLRFVAFAAEREVVVWDLQARREVLRTAHGSTVTAVAFSPDSRLLASGGLDKIAKITAIPSGMVVARFAHLEQVETVAFSADGSRLATGTGSVAARLLKRPSLDDAAHVWDVASGARLARLPHDHAVQAVAFDPDASRLATGSLDGTARVWNVETAREIARVRHDDGVHTVAFSPNGRYVASASKPYLIASRNQTVQVWEAASGQEIGRIHHEGGVRHLAFSPDGRWIASVGDDRTARLLAYSGVEAARLAFDDVASVVAFTQDGRLVIGGGTAVHILPAEAGSDRKRIPLEGHASLIALSPDGKRMAITEFKNAIRVWDVETAKTVFVAAHQGFALFAAFSPDGRWLATAAHDGTAKLWDAVSGELHKMLTHGDAVLGVAFSPDGRRLATIGSDKTAKIWNVEDGSMLLRLEHPERVAAIRFSPKGTHVATGTTSGSVHWWDIDSGHEVTRSELGFEVGHVAVSSDGERIAAAGFNALSIVWQASSGNELARLVHPGRVSAIEYAPDGRLVTATWNGIVRVWSARNPAADIELRQEDHVSALAFTRDGRYLATSSDDRTARVWRISDAREVARLDHPVSVSGVAFALDERILVTTSGDQLAPPHTAHLWRWRLSDLAQEACSRLSRNLTLVEWQRHLPNEPYRRTCPQLPPHGSVLEPLFEQARSAARRGETRVVARRYAQIMREIDGIQDATLANQVCWLGSVDGAARLVLPACERAVALSPDESQFRDSRGLARALTGDPAGAIDDFGAYVGWTRKSHPESPLIAKREAWIGALRAGTLPFDAEVLAELRNE